MGNDLDPSPIDDREQRRKIAETIRATIQEYADE
jgi:hypothetical protein